MQSGVFGISEGKATGHHEICVTGANGYTTVGNIRRYLSIKVKRGSAIDYIDNAVVGGMFVARLPGRYAITVREDDAAQRDFAITLDPTDQNAVSDDATKIVAYGITSGTNEGISTISGTVYMYPGDSIRVKSSGTSAGGSTEGTACRVIYLGP